MLRHKHCLETTWHGLGDHPLGDMEDNWRSQKHLGHGRDPRGSAGERATGSKTSLTGVGWGENTVFPVEGTEHNDSFFATASSGASITVPASRKL